MITDRKYFAYLDEMQVVTIILPLSYNGGASASFSIIRDQKPISMDIVGKMEIEAAIKYVCRPPFEPSFGETYWIVDQNGERTDLQIGAVIRTHLFDQEFYYSGNDLGISCREDQTSFKLWAPTATQILLKLASPDGVDSQVFEMKRADKGIWIAVVPKNLEYWHYSYFVCVNLEWRVAVDPYAVAVTANGILGVIVDLAKTKTSKPSLPALEHPVDAIIYETHIRDFSIHPDSGMKAKGKYLGAAEMNTIGKDGKPTGLSYLKELDITHIEFLPFHDFEGVNELEETEEYNWGYNPLHFNAPDGSYSSNPRDPYSRIRELKSMIASIHQNGLRVIMDVVYNHVYIREQSAFEKIVPGYYFRHDEHGLPSNGTGVGNDIASERLMVRKFILDSVRFWMEEYHIDGFRFDLMGILDVDTMAEVRKTVDRISPDALIIGEGWDLNTPLAHEKKATIRNQAILPSIGQFNDWFRDSIKGSTFNLYDKGYALGNDHYLEAAKQVMGGSVGLEKKENGLFTEPGQAVNYVESHDNHTMWDKLCACFQVEPESTRMRYHRLATCMVLLAQGVPFLHSGQEFFRTKELIGNSYRSPDSINRLDWQRKIKYEDNIHYIKGIIRLRKRFGCFRLRSAHDIRNNMKTLPLPSSLIGYTLQIGEGDPDRWSQILVLVNSGASPNEILLPDGEWLVLVDSQTAGTEPIRAASVKPFAVEGISLHVLAKK
jgi:pullulanase